MTKITRETEEDWDQAISELNVVHPDDVVSLDSYIEDFDDYSDGETLTSPWVQGDIIPVVSDNQSYSGDISLHIDANSEEGTLIGHGGIPSTPSFFNYKYWETSNNQETFIRFLNENADEICFVGTDNPQVVVTNGSSSKNDVFSNPSPDYQEWRQFELTFDWDNDQFDWVWNDLTGSSSQQTGTNFDFTNSSSSVSSMQIWNYSFSGTDCYIDDIEVEQDSGYIITTGVGPQTFVKTVEETFGVDYRTSTGDTIVADFEDGNLNDWFTSEGDGGSITTDAYEGNNALEISISGGSNSSISSTSGLNAYPAQGNTFEFHVKSPDGGSNNQVKFAYALTNGFRGGNDDCYVVDFRYGDGQINFNRRNSGNSSTLDTNSVSIPTSEWLRCQIQWGGNGDHIVTVWNASDTQIHSMTNNDTDYTSGGIGFTNNSTGSTSGQLDSIIITGGI